MEIRKYTLCCCNDFIFDYNRLKYVFSLGSGAGVKKIEIRK